jgi:hypothetical protein
LCGLNRNPAFRIVKVAFDPLQALAPLLVCPKIYSLADLLEGLMSTINAAAICIAAAKANGTT